MYKFGFICVTLVVSISNVKGINDSQKSKIQAKFLSSGIDCIKDHSLTADDIKAFRAKMIPDRENAKCFAACLFKRIGIMDDMGKMTKEGALESAKEVFNDEDHLKRVDMFFDKCASVNKEIVSDGKKGCDRAKLAFTCIVKHAPEYGFNMDF